MGFAEIAALLAQLGGTAIGKISEGHARGAAEQERAKAAAMWQNLQGPQFNELEAPELKSAFEGIETDPRMQAIQSEALNRLVDRSKDGWSTEDRAMMQQAQNTSNQGERSQREAIMQKYSNQGQAGQNTELAQQLMAQQGGANRTNQFGMDQARAAQQRALQSIQATGDMSYRQRGQAFDEGATKARARDSIAGLNAGYNQWAQQGNNQNAMNTANYNMNRVAGATGQANQTANAKNVQGTQDAAFYSGAGQAGAQTVAALTDEEKKKKGYG